MKFAFIDAEKAFHRITKLCWLLKGSRAGFYAWCGRPPSGHAIEDARLTMRNRHKLRYKDDGSENPDFVLKKPAYRLRRASANGSSARRTATTTSRSRRTSSTATSRRIGRTRSGWATRPNS